MADQSLSLEIFLKHTYEDIEKKIDEIITDQNILAILKDGKRLRPLLGAISFKACTGGNESSQLYQQFLEGAVAIELTSDDLREIDSAASKITVQGARYPEKIEQMTGR